MDRLVVRDARGVVTAELVLGLGEGDDCFELMDQYVERRLADPAYTDDAMDAHLAGCSACAEEVDSLTALLTAGG